MDNAAKTRTIKLRRRPVAEQRDIYQAKLVWAVAALQQITWHIGCDQVERGVLGLTNTMNGQRVFFNDGCPACIAKKALDKIAATQDNEV